MYGCQLTAVVAIDTVEARLYLVAALSLAAKTVVKVTDVAGNITSSSHSGERQEESRLEGSHCRCD